ncbi:MAG: efflux RND transporter periplasmic adaptor subunit [Maricaulis sp.]|uniref:efflux RND transporter periplasmic adaptor subunit n=1 Tax=Maricaulis sp. TaxID=1486257 RepID=UPI001B010A32|nr:efflux RND transporter periplasmic adaptor subunit [Maricaulis sp.]MBO6728226.1 efflux RND transporter periplasmic adaptor subunit [Maricaulis sp.]MBO6846771.1 efflux RND transporter periplasmic adaptor subunit [Maricaulis sp.]MBO6877868.1 efflux RND transporter periplasmic adaptor subunit [Maricaulis sp.]
MKWIIGIAAVAVLAVAGWFFTQGGETAGEIRIETSAAQTGSVRRSVAASGAVRALVTVEVGSQLSGQLAELHVDFNDTVEEGQVIAQLDPQTFETRVREAEASRATAAASLALQRASYQRVQANTRSARLEFQRIETLAERGNASRAALDNAQTSLDAAEAELSVAQAQIANAEAVLQQRDATLAGARIDLDRTTIRAPINGIVVDRAVDEGQTVAASLSAPTLFTIAQDLSQVQIDAQIDEADIGQIREGQSVSFTVDAYPSVQMNGQVEQIRLAPTTLQNVVTYTVVVSAANPGQRLLPGMTANMDIVTGEREDVLVVTNAALRFRPSPALADRTDALPEAGAGGPRRGAGGPGGGRGGPGGQMARLAEQLDLTQDQQDRAQQAFRSAFGRAAAQAQSGGEFDRAAVQQEIDRELQTIFTPEQMAQYREISRQARETRPGTVWVETAEGRLEERRVRLGISDSQNTEVVGGNLQADEAVIVRAREVRE